MKFELGDIVQIKNMFWEYGRIIDPYPEHTLDRRVVGILCIKPAVLTGQISYCYDDVLTKLTKDEVDKLVELMEIEALASSGS